MTFILLVQSILHPLPFIKPNIAARQQSLSKCTILKQSRCVCRRDSGESRLMSGHGYLGDDNLDNKLIESPNTVELPAQSYNTAESVGAKRGYSVSRKKDPSTQMQNKRPAKRRYKCSAFEELSLVPFSELPHPKDLFGKRSGFDKKEKSRTSTVDSHKMQLRRKLTQHDLTKAEIPRIIVNTHEDIGVQVYNTSKSLSDVSYKGAAMGKHTGYPSFKVADYEDRTSKMLSYSLNEYPSLIVPFQKTDTVDRVSHFPINVYQTEFFEE